jgi:porin
MTLAIRIRALAAALLLPTLAEPLRAQAAPEHDQAPQAAEPQGQPPASIASSLGDLGGLRDSLRAEGVTFGITYVGEMLANLRGGIRRGAIYEGKLDAQLDVDLDRLAGLAGLAFHAQMYQIHGRGLSRYKLGNLMTASGIEALPSTRLVEIWLEQVLFDGKLAIRAGQLAGDTEFLTSQYASLFINGSFGWPAITSVNLPAGGVSYPWATPAVRVKAEPAKDITILAAVFNGDPSGGGIGEPQLNNRYGTRFPVHNAPFFIGEVAYAYSLGDGASALPGTAKLGAWYHAGRFDDQRYDSTGLSLASPASSGVPRRHRGNLALYAIVDQMLWRQPETADNGIGAFARLFTNPGDRNEVGFYADGGFNFKGMLASRPDDTLGIAFGYTRISNRARALDRDVRALGAAGPIRSSEALVEITYQAQIVPGWSVQPDFQYIWRPGGHIANPRGPTGRAIRNAAVLGIRSTIQY